MSIVPSKSNYSLYVPRAFTISAIHIERYDVTSSAKLMSALALIKAFTHSKFPLKDAFDKGVVLS